MDEVAERAGRHINCRPIGMHLSTGVRARSDDARIRVRRDGKVDV